MSAVAEWNTRLAEMKANIDVKLVKDDALHLKLEREMEAIYARLTPDEQRTVEKPRRPLLNSERSLIAHNDKGQLIGFEDDES